MKKLQEQELRKIKGGITLSGTLLNSFTSLLKVLLDAGRALGSSIRRLDENAICPLK